MLRILRAFILSEVWIYGFIEFFEVLKNNKANSLTQKPLEFLKEISAIFSEDSKKIQFANIIKAKFQKRLAMLHNQELMVNSKRHKIK